MFVDMQSETVGKLWVTLPRICLGGCGKGQD